MVYVSGTNPMLFIKISKKGEINYLFAQRIREKFKLHNLQDRNFFKKVHARLLRIRSTSERLTLLRKCNTKRRKTELKVRTQIAE